MFKADALQGKVALVIGGSSESGPKVCEVLARHGADVALSFHTREKRAAEVAARCRSYKVRSQAFRFDLLHQDEVMQLVPDILSVFGRLDILINLGGPPPVYTNLRDIDEAGFDLMMNGHVKGCFFLAREAGKHMEQQGSGLIVNVSATSSLKYSHAAYGFAKACVNEMTRFLAYTFSPQVRVINLIPGMIDLEETASTLREERAERSPLKRIVSPEEIGLLIVAASSPAFQSVTGESLLADGGFWLLHP